MSGYWAMVTRAVQLLDDDDLRVKRLGVRFPLELRPPGFVADDIATWPDVEGRLEYVDGRVLYMPPCADTQQYVAVDVVFVLRTWVQSHPGFVVGANEAGMKLGDDVRGADAAVWRRADVGTASGHIQHVAPVLAVEVAGTDEGEAELRTKARWYIDHGVAAVWIVLPDTEEALVITPAGESRHKGSDRLAAVAELGGLSPKAAEFFAQLRGA